MPAQSHRLPARCRRPSPPPVAGRHPPGAPSCAPPSRRSSAAPPAGRSQRRSRSGRCRPGPTSGWRKRGNRNDPTPIGAPSPISIQSAGWVSPRRIASTAPQSPANRSPASGRDRLDQVLNGVAEAGAGARATDVDGSGRPDVRPRQTSSIRIATGGPATTGLVVSRSSASSIWLRAHLWVTKITGAVGSLWPC